MNNYEISLFELETPTNKDLTISFTPSKNTSYYKYSISKDGEKSEYIIINNNKNTEIFLNGSGIYQIEIISYDAYNTPSIITTGLYKIDKEAPVIEVDELHLQMPKGSELLVMEGVRAIDKFEGDITSKITTNEESIDFNQLGRKELIYTVSDQAGNITTKTVYIDVIKNNTNSVLILNSFIIFLIAIALLLLAKISKTIKLEKRVGKYGVEPIIDNTKSITDNLLEVYVKIQNKIYKIISKSAIIKKWSKKYDKYVNVVNNTYKSGIDFISEKIVITSLLLLLAILFKSTRGELLNIYETVIPFFLGFVLTDIVNAYKFREYRSKLENDLLQAITIMNNAFKAGRSILQSVELVTQELEGPIANEFKKIYIEINFGLAVDVVFSRFAERIKLEEVTYLTVSLSILNKTGGNIIKVFSSIEKTLFNKKKLELELKALTGSSKIIVGVLILMPIFFVAVLYIMDPLYFMPFINTLIGNILVMIMFIIYFMYIVVVRKIIKVRM